MRVHTLLFAFRDIVYGFMIVFGIPDVKHSSLYRELATWHATLPFGISLAVLGLFSAVSTVRRRDRVTSATMGASAWFWGFVSMTFLTTGNPAAGCMFLFGFTMSTGYIGYRYKWNRKNNSGDSPKGEYMKEETDEGRA